MSETTENSQPIDLIRSVEPVRYAPWHEIAAWARQRGIEFRGDVGAVNRARKREGKPPFQLMPGPLRARFRG